MDINTILQNGLTSIFKDGALTTNITIISYAIPSGSYDDNTTQTITGSIVTSGLVFPVRGKFGSEESLLLEQGKLKNNDKVLYIGSINTSGNLLLDIQGNKYAIIPDGIKTWDITGSTAYNKIFVRLSNTGSLY